MSDTLLLVATIAGTRVALPAADVEGVIELDTLIPVPCAPAHVAGLSALRSRVLTVIDCQSALGLGTTDFGRPILEAAVAQVEGHHYALSVDAVEDVCEMLGESQPVRAAMAAGWEHVASGMVDTEQGTLLLIDIAKLIAGEPEKKTDRKVA